MPTSSTDTAPPRRASIRAKILSIGAVGAIALLLLACVVTWGLNRINDDADDLGAAAESQRTALRLQAQAYRVSGRLGVNALTVGTEGRSAAQDSSETRTDYRTALTEFQDYLGTLPQQENPDVAAAVTAISGAMNDLNKADAQAHAMYLTGKATQITAADKVLAEASNTALDIINPAADKAANSARTALAAEQASLDDTRTLMSVVTWLTTALALAALVALALWISRGILRSTQAVRRTLIAMQDADLTVPCQATSADELGDMAVAAEQTRLAMSTIVGEVASTADTVLSSSHALSSAAEQMNTTSAGSSDQAERASRAAGDVSQNIQTVAAGTEEMTASIREISKSANDAAAVASQAVQVADRTNATVSKLGESSIEIGNVVKSITSIAEQTNLLALNATIEAARAGEAGKGFAVVANEVKDLAQETGKATEDIGRRVEAIQADTEAAVAAISEIASIIAQINDSQSTIASAVEEQTATTNEMGRNVTDAAAGAGDIASNIEGVATSVGETRSAVSDTSRAAHELSERATRMQELVGRFTY